MVTAKHMELLKDGCIVGNMGHSVHEIDVVRQCSVKTILCV